jgi:hypothetical protein
MRYSIVIIPILIVLVLTGIGLHTTIDFIFSNKKSPASIISSYKESAEIYKEALEKKDEDYKRILEEKDNYYNKDKKWVADLTQDCISAHYEHLKEGKESVKDFYKHSLGCADIIRPGGVVGSDNLKSDEN